MSLGHEKQTREAAKQAEQNLSEAKEAAKQARLLAKSITDDWDHIQKTRSAQEFILKASTVEFVTLQSHRESAVVELIDFSNPESMGTFKIRFCTPDIDRKTFSVHYRVTRGENPPCEDRCPCVSGWVLQQVESPTEFRGGQEWFLIEGTGGQYNFTFDFKYTEKWFTKDFLTIRIKPVM